MLFLKQHYTQSSLFNQNIETCQLSSFLIPVRTKEPVRKVAYG